jgi:hypothetical protein
MGREGQTCSGCRGIPRNICLLFNREIRETAQGMLTNSALDKVLRNGLHIVRVFGNRRLNLYADILLCCPAVALSQTLS